MDIDRLIRKMNEDKVKHNAKNIQMSTIDRMEKEVDMQLNTNKRQKVKVKPKYLKLAVISAGIILAVVVAINIPKIINPDKVNTPIASPQITIEITVSPEMIAEATASPEITTEITLSPSPIIYSEEGGVLTIHTREHVPSQEYSFATTTFKEETNYTVEYVVWDYKKMSLDIAAGVEGSDIFMLSSGITNTDKLDYQIEQGLLYDISGSDYIKEMLTNIHPVITEPIIKQDSIYALPISARPHLGTAEAVLIEESGFRLQDYQSWNSIVESGAPFRLDPTYNRVIQPLLQYFSYASQNNIETPLDTNMYNEAISTTFKLAQGVKSDKFDYVDNPVWFRVDYYPGLTQLHDRIIMPAPTLSGESIELINTDYYCINVNSDNKEAALYFLELYLDNTIKPQAGANAVNDPIERLFTHEFLIDQGFKITPNEEFYFDEYMKNAYLFYDYPLISWEIEPIVKDFTDGFITEDEALELIKEKYELYHIN